jgi:hypothetical protein
MPSYVHPSNLYIRDNYFSYGSHAMSTSYVDVDGLLYVCKWWKFIMKKNSITSLILFENFKKIG